MPCRKSSCSTPTWAAPRRPPALSTTATRTGVVPGCIGHFDHSTMQDTMAAQLGRSGALSYVRGPLKKPTIGFVRFLELVPVAERRQERLELRPLGLRHFEAGEHAAEVGAVIAIVEEADVPAASQSVEKLQQRPGPLRKLESAQPLAGDMRRPAADHVPDVKLRHLVSR